MKTFLAQECEGTIIRQRGHSQFYSRKTGEENRTAVGVEFANGIQHAQSINVIVVVWRKGKVYDRDTMWLGFECERGFIETGGDIHLQPAIRENLTDDLLPRMIIFNH